MAAKKKITARHFGDDAMIGFAFKKAVKAKKAPKAKKKAAKKKAAKK